MPWNTAAPPAVAPRISTDISAVAFLFDTDALSELLRPHPAPAFVEFLAGLPRDDQFTSAVVVGELYKGAFRSHDLERHLENIEERVLPCVTVLPYDVAAAREFGRIRADLEDRGEPLPDADLQIAATSIVHGLTLVTGNLRHFRRIAGIRLSRALARTRS